MEYPATHEVYDWSLLPSSIRALDRIRDPSLEVAGMSTLVSSSMALTEAAAERRAAVNFMMLQGVSYIEGS